MASTVIVMSRRNGILCHKQNDKVGNLRMGGSSPSKYMIFLYYSRIAELIGDEKWKHFFEIMSRGSFWKGLKFDGTQLISKKKNVTKTFLVLVSGDMNIDTDLENDLPYYEECKDFIKANSSHFALKEDAKATLNAQNCEPIKSGFENSVSKQAMYINEFAMRKAREFLLSENDRLCMVSSIFSKLSNKSLVPKTSFKFGSSGFIDSIEGLHIDNTGYYFDENIGPPQSKRSTNDSSSDAIVSKKIVFKCSKNLALCMRKTPSYHL